MRKFYLFFALLIGISSAAWADNFSPTEGAVYVIKNNRTEVYATYNSGVNSNSNNILTVASKNALTVNSFFVIEAINGDASNGFTIRLKNDETRYVYAINTGNNDSNIGTKRVTDGTTPDDCKWDIVLNGTGTYNIKPHSLSNGWNVRGTVSGVSTIGLWHDNSDTNNKWKIQTLANLASECSTQYTAGKVAIPVQSWVDVANTATGKATTLNETWSADNASAFVAAWNTYFTNSTLLIKPTSASGLFTIKNRYRSAYLYQDENDAKGVTRANSAVNGAKYYYAITFDENSNNIVIKTSQGKYPTRGNKDSYSAITEPLIFGENGTVNIGTRPEGGWVEGYFAFPYEFINTGTVNGGDYNTDTNPYFVSNYPTGSGQGKQYMFEAVNLADGEQIYTVHVDRSVYNCDAKVTYKNDSYTGNKNVYDSGFYVLSGAVDASSFSAVNINENPYYIANVAIEGTNINVTYTYNTAQYAQDLIDASNAEKVGYPTNTSDVFTALNTALTNYNNDNSAEKLEALVTSISNYEGEANNVYLPVNV